MSNWYVIVDANGRYLPLGGGQRSWVSNLRDAEVFPRMGRAKQALQRYAKSHAGCRIERLARLPDRLPRRRGS